MIQVPAHDTENESTQSGQRLAVVVVTYCRPDFVERCLDALLAQGVGLEIVVVDSSPDDRTADAVALRDGVQYLRNPNGIGHMTQSRNLGWTATSAPVVAFIDDDAFAHPGWATSLLEAYSDSTIGAVGGRALNDQPGEESEGVDRIGRLLDNGDLTGHFAADPGGPIDVDHVIGCNMSFRRSVLEELAGFRETFPGTALREDTDMCLRVRSLGYRLVFEPRAVVDHVGAPHARGARFDTRYQYFGQRNHVAMLIWNFGWSGLTRRYLFESAHRSGRAVGVAGFKLGLWFAATCAGIVAGVRGRR